MPAPFVRLFALVISSALLTLSLFGCDSSAGSKGGKDSGTPSSGADGAGAVDGPALSDDFQGPPIVEAVLPLVAISGGFIYVEGQNLATPSGSVKGVEVRVIGKDAGGLDVDIQMDIEKGESVRLTVRVPDDMHTRIAGAGTVRVKTPAGEIDFPSPIFSVEDSGFGGAAEEGKGLVGMVYALQNGTSKLPDFSNPCADPSVVPGGACPYTVLLVPNLAVPNTPFQNGFPGLGTTLVEWFAIHFSGFLVVDEAGTYLLETCSDDGSNLYMDAGAGLTKVVSNDGLHGMACQSGSIDLPAGVHEIVVDYYQGPATMIGIEAYWTPPGGQREIIPPASFALFRD